MLGIQPEASEAAVPETSTPLPAFQSLDTVRIVGGKRTTGRLDEFETRYLNRLATASFNRADIEKVNPVDTWQMLSRVASVKFMPTGKTGGQFPLSGRGFRVDAAGAQPCYMSVMIDGVLMLPNPGEPAFDVSRLPSPEDVHGIEVFAGPGSIPPKYNGAGGDKTCGLIAIWTR